MKIIHVDINHRILIEKLDAAGFVNYENYSASETEIKRIIRDYDGIVIRSRFKIDRNFINAASQLKFIARVGAGLESIDQVAAAERGITLISAPEGNRNAVGEHTLGMILSLFNKLNKVDREVREGIWERERNRGAELDGKIVGIIGYGNMGKAFAKKLKGFDCKVIFHDIKKNIGDDNAVQVPLEVIQETADVLSLHTPWTPLTNNMVNSTFIERFQKPFWFINTSRGNCAVTSDLVSALKSGRLLGAGLDVLEYEKDSFESLFDLDEVPVALQELLKLDNVLLSPHIAGWTLESKQKLANVIADKIILNFKRIS